MNFVVLILMVFHKVVEDILVIHRAIPEKSTVWSQHHHNWESLVSPWNMIYHQITRFKVIQTINTHYLWFILCLLSEECKLFCVHDALFVQQVCEEH